MYLCIVKLISVMPYKKKENDRGHTTRTNLRAKVSPPCNNESEMNVFIYRDIAKCMCFYGSKLIFDVHELTHKRI